MPERFLIVKPSSLGDIVHAFPAVSMLTQAFPGAVVDWVAVPAFAGLVKCHPAVDRVIIFKRKELGTMTGFLREFPKLVKELRKERYTAVIDLQGLLRSALIGRIARARVYVGPAAPREKTALAFYTKKMNAGEAYSHAVMKICRMMAAFLGQPLPEPIVFDLPPDQNAAGKAAETISSLSDCRHLIAVAPGARWESKEWPVAFFADSINRIAAEWPGCAFLLLGTKDESERCAELLQLLKAPALDLSGKTTLAELVEMIRSADLMLSNDSGPMHIAAAVQTPVIAVFGPTDPVLTGPFQKKDLVLRPGLPCELCFRRKCSNPACHSRITADQVIALIRKENLLA